MTTPWFSSEENEHRLRPVTEAGVSPHTSGFSADRSAAPISAFRIVSRFEFRQEVQEAVEHPRHAVNGRRHSASISTRP